MTHRLDDIGVTGRQCDVTDGGDVDPQTGRLLTIAEMQRALRLVRQSPLSTTADDGYVDDPAGTATGSPWPDRSSRSVGENGNEDREDWLLPDEPAATEDPYRWDDTDPADDTTGAGPDEDDPVSPAGQRRGDHLGDRLGEKRRWRLFRSRGGRRPKRKARSDDWLPQNPGQAPVVEGGVGSAGAWPGRRGRRGAASTAVAAGSVVGGEDFEVAAAPRGFTAVFWRWVARLLLVVLVLAGINAVFVRPFRDTPGTAPAVSGVDAAAAAALAARFTADYLSYVSTAPGGNTAALTAQLAGSAGVSRLVFTGTGYVRADLVQTGQVTPVDDGHALVAVTARLRLATPPAGGGQPDGAAAGGPAAVAADPGPVPAGWTDLGSRWVALVVPVETTPAGLRVSAAGPVFSTEPPGQVTVPDVTTGIDADTVTATRDVAAAFFTGYAASNVAYLAAPGISMGGLGGAVTLASVDNWSIAIPTTDTGGSGPADPVDPAAATSGVGSGSVTWQLAGTELTVSQQYTVAMTHADGRWYAAALSPTRATTP